MSLRFFERVLKSNLDRYRCFSYKSSISLDKLYPESSSVKKFTPPTSDNGKFSGYIPIEDLSITYCRASGPGGQHVNKTETKVDLRFHVNSAKWLNSDTREKLSKKHITKITKDGFFVIKSEKTRYKQLNLADAMTRLRSIIYAIEEPEPVITEETAEKVRKNMEKATRQRLMEKRQRGRDKADRQTL